MTKDQEIAELKDKLEYWENRETIWKSIVRSKMDTINHLDIENDRLCEIIKGLTSNDRSTD